MSCLQSIFDVAGLGVLLLTTVSTLDYKRLIASPLDYKQKYQLRNTNLGATENGFHENFEKVFEIYLAHIYL